jgi:hypothetical protein
MFTAKKMPLANYFTTRSSRRLKQRDRDGLVYVKRVTIDGVPGLVGSGFYPE